MRKPIRAKLPKKQFKVERVTDGREDRILLMPAQVPTIDMAQVRHLQAEISKAQHRRFDPSIDRIELRQVTEDYRKLKRDLAQLVGPSSAHGRILNDRAASPPVYRIRHPKDRGWFVSVRLTGNRQSPYSISPSRRLPPSNVKDFLPTIRALVRNETGYVLSEGQEDNERQLLDVSGTMTLAQHRSKLERHIKVVRNAPRETLGETQRRIANQKITRVARKPRTRARMMTRTQWKETRSKWKQLSTLYPYESERGPKLKEWYYEEFPPGDKLPTMEKSTLIRYARSRHFPR